jgi:hypothetical protein
MRSFDPRAVGAPECRAWEAARALMTRFHRLLVRSYAALLAPVHR